MSEIISSGSGGMQLPPIVQQEIDSINYSQWLNDGQDSWQLAAEKPITDLESLREFACQFCFAGLTEMEQNIVLTYGMTPSALSHQLPILLLSGMSGCGKTQASVFLDKLRGGSNVINGGSVTYASVRNLIQIKRFPSGNKGKERNCLIVLDDLKTEKLLADDTLYSFLRSGYNRETDLVTRAGVEAGTIMEFRTFSAKVLSSVDNLYNHPQLTELARRSIPIRMKKSADFKHQLNFDDYAWDGFANIFDAFWRDVRNVELYVKQKKLLRTKLRKNDIPLVYLDLITCYGVFGGRSLQESTNFGIGLMNYCDALKKVQDSATKQLCENFLAQMLQLEKLEASKLEIPPPTKVIYFRPIDLNRFLQKEKETTGINLSKNVPDELKALGYFLVFSDSHNCLMWCYLE